MAEKKEHKPEEREEKHEGKKREGGGKHEGKKPKKHLHAIVTTFAHDGTAMHEHHYKAHKEDHHTEPPVFAGTSQNMEDLHQHMEDHAGPVMNQGEGEEGGGEPDGDEGQQGGAPQGGPPEE